MLFCVNSVKWLDVVVVMKVMLFNVSYVIVDFRVKIVLIDIVGLVCFFFYVVFVIWFVSFL